MAVRAFITGLAGTTITPDERAFLREREPWGLIIFARNGAAGEGAPPAGFGSRRGGARCPRARGPGRRPRPAPRPAALADLSAGCRLWPLLRPQRCRGDKGRISRRPADRRRSGGGRR